MSVEAEVAAVASKPLVFPFRSVFLQSDSSVVFPC